MTLPADFDMWRASHDPAADSDEDDLCDRCAGMGEVGHIVYGRNGTRDIGGELQHYECVACGGAGRK